MSLLLDALHRGDGKGRGKDYAYLYSAEEQAEPDAPPAQPASTSRPDARPTGFKRPVRKAPRWVFLVCGGSLALALSAGAAWLWFESASTNASVSAYTPSVNAALPRPVPSASASVTPAPPVTVPTQQPPPSTAAISPPTAANAATVSTPIAAAEPLPIPSTVANKLAERAPNAPKLSVSVLPSSSLDKTDDGQLRSVPGDVKDGQDLTVPRARRGQNQSHKERPVNKSEHARSAVSAPSASLAHDVVPKSELAFELANAWALLERGQWAEAEADYRVIIGRSKIAEPDAVLGLAVALHRQKRWGEALVAYEASLRVWPGNPVASPAMLDILAHTNATNAESRLKQWITDRPQDAAAFSTYGLLLGRKASWPEAVGMLRRARELEPANGTYAYNLAVALDQSHRYVEAAEQYQAALVLGGLGATSAVVKSRLSDIAHMVRP